MYLSLILTPISNDIFYTIWSSSKNRLLFAKSSITYQMLTSTPRIDPVHCAKNQTTIQFHRTNVLAFLRDNILYLNSQIDKTVFKIGLYMSSQYSLFQPFMLGISRIKGFVTELPPPSLPALPSNIICTLFEGYIFTIIFWKFGYVQKIVQNIYHEIRSPLPTNTHPVELSWGPDGCMFSEWINMAWTPIG